MKLRRSHGTLVWLALAALAFLQLGCGKAKTWTFNNDVQGTLKEEGKPLAGVIIQFIPDDINERGPISTGQTDVDGHFQLAVSAEQSGSVIGPHRVVLRPNVSARAVPKHAGDTEPSAELVQAMKKNPPVHESYNSAGRTPLRVEVSPDVHTYDLVAERAPSKPPVK